MKSVTIPGVKRTELGKKSTKAVRRAGNIPCVIYGGAENIHFSSTKLGVRDLVYTPDFKIAEIELDGKKHRCVLKSTDFHPVTDEIIHMDFVELVPNKKVKIQVPILTHGVAPGVKEGGILVRKLRKAQIKTIPEKLVDGLHVDISELTLGSSVRVRDIDTIEGIEIMNNGGIPVLNVEVPRALKSADEEAAEAEEAAAAAEAAEAAEGAEGAEGAAAEKTPAE